MHESSELRVGDDVLVVSEHSHTAGPTFLLVHGIGMGKDAYLEFFDELGDLGTAIALDLPGFGDSPEPATALTIPDFADLVAAFLTARDSRPVVAIGHSMGTQVLAELAVRHPSAVSSLVLIGPTVNARERTAGWQVFRMLQDLAGESLRVLLRGLALYVKTGVGWFVRTFRMMIAHRLESIAPSITVPTLVLRGERDRVCPADWVASVAALIPDAVVTEVPGKSHEAMISSAEPVAGLIGDFVRRWGLAAGDRHIASPM